MGQSHFNKAVEEGVGIQKQYQEVNTVHGLRGREGEEGERGKREVARLCVCVVSVWWGGGGYMTFDSDRSTKTDFLSNSGPRLCCVPAITTIKHLQNHKYCNH